MKHQTYIVASIYNAVPTTWVGCCGPTDKTGQVLNICPGKTNAKKHIHKR